MTNSVLGTRSNRSDETTRPPVPASTYSEITVAMLLASIPISSLACTTRISLEDTAGISPTPGGVRISGALSAHDAIITTHDSAGTSPIRRQGNGMFASRQLRMVDGSRQDGGTGMMAGSVATGLLSILL